MKITWLVGLVAWWAMAARRAEVQVFFGNLHSHTSFSDGSGKPDEAFKAARKGGLHFLAVTEHNHKEAKRMLKSNDPRKDGILIAKTPALYNGAQSDSLISAARRRTVPGQFVAIYGQEFSTITSGNHANVFEVAEVIDERSVSNGNFKALVEWLGSRPDSQGQPAKEIEAERERGKKGSVRRRRRPVNFFPRNVLRRTMREHLLPQRWHPLPRSGVRRALRVNRLT